MILTKCFFDGKVIFLISLAVILTSSTLIDNHQQHQHRKHVADARHATTNQQTAPKYKYYTNKKGSEVIEIGPGNACQIFQGEDAVWIQETKRDAVKALNYIQFRLMIGKCQLEAFLNNRAPPYAPPLVKRESTTTEGSRVDANNANSTRDGSLVHPVATGHPPTKNDTSTSTNDVAEPTDAPKLPLIFPGTKWCGAGSSAKNHDDLGIYVETDKCCRSHDLCEDNMEGKECKHGLCNDSEFTRSHCECDEKFRTCLQRDKTFSTLASFKIANLYFNILKPLCYAERPPVKWCRRHRITGECIDFEFDPGYRSEWQFFPAQPFLTEAVQKLINPTRPAEIPFYPPPPQPPSKEPEDEEEDDDDEDGRKLGSLKQD